MHGLDLFREKLIFLISRVIKIPFLMYYLLIDRIFNDCAEKFLIRE